jgi:hypothetical protein
MLIKEARLSPVMFIGFLKALAILFSFSLFFIKTLERSERCTSDVFSPLGTITSQFRQLGGEVKVYELTQSLL